MRLRKQIAEEFELHLERLLRTHAAEIGWIEKSEDLDSVRFLNRSLLPHLERLAQLFNRQRPDGTEIPIEKTKYWGESSNPKNLRLAYALHYLPCNALRMACVFDELDRLGIEWDQVLGDSASVGGKPLRVAEWGAGPGSGLIGFQLAHRHLRLASVRPTIELTAIEPDRISGEFGIGLLNGPLRTHVGTELQAKYVQRRLETTAGAKERATSEKSDLILMNYVLNELEGTPEQLARMLLQLIDSQLEENGLIVIVESALKVVSRRLLQVREALIPMLAPAPEKNAPAQPVPRRRVLLPCLGHQACGALAAPEDWCHDSVQWWRPPILRELDKLTGLDHRTLPFSYLVLQKGKGELTQVPAGSNAFARLVSPSRKEGPFTKFYVCSARGKEPCRTRKPERIAPEGEDSLERGDLIPLESKDLDWGQR